MNVRSNRTTVSLFRGIMKILMCDIDGVLNSTQSNIYHKRNGATNFSYKDLSPLCPIALSNLKYILEYAPDIKIVLSSSWKSIFNLKDIADHIGVELIDKTFNLNTHRGAEIKEWIIRHPEVENFVILDDCADMEPYMDRLVQTNADIGLTIVDAREVLKKFRIKYDFIKPIEL